MPFRLGSRSSEPLFDWEDQATWARALRDVKSVYLVYYPDLAVPGAAAAIRSFADLAVQSGVQHLVLLSGRGEDEAQRCEQVVQESGVKWTNLRASWFSQNFSENFMRDLVLGGEVALPAGNVAEPFVDAEDIAEVAVAALTEEGHADQLYEVTGPRLLTFAEAVGEIARATSQEIRYVPISHEEFATTLADQKLSPDVRDLLISVHDGSGRPECAPQRWGSAGAGSKTSGFRRVRSCRCRVWRLAWLGCVSDVE